MLVLPNQPKIWIRFTMKVDLFKPIRHKEAIHLPLVYVGQAFGRFVVAFEDDSRMYRAEHIDLYIENIPEPKKVRVTPTQADLDDAKAKGLGGIPCWVRDREDRAWYEVHLTGIATLGDECFVAGGCTWRYCEIEKEVQE